MQVALLEQHGNNVYARIHCSQKEWERIEALQYSEALIKAPNTQSKPCCHYPCGGVYLKRCSKVKVCPIYK